MRVCEPMARPHLMKHNVPFLSKLHKRSRIQHTQFFAAIRPVKASACEQVIQFDPAVGIGLLKPQRLLCSGIQRGPDGSQGLGGLLDLFCVAAQRAQRALSVHAPVNVAELRVVVGEGEGGKKSAKWTKWKCFACNGYH